MIEYRYNPRSGKFDMVSAGSSSTSVFQKLASLSTNLINVGANTLAFESGVTAANSTPTAIIIELTNNDTFDNNGGTVDFALKLNGNAMVFLGNASAMDVISALTFGDKAVGPIANGTSGLPIVSGAGSYALPVTVGTGANFRISISIWGIKP